jgi:hypothetical protein
LIAEVADDRMLSGPVVLEADLLTGVDLVRPSQSPEGGPDATTSMVVRSMTAHR